MNTNQTILEIKETLDQANKYFINRKLLQTYSLYKKLYKKFGIQELIPEMVNVTFVSNKQNLLKNRNLKFKLIDGILNYGLKRVQKKDVIFKLVSLKLKLYRDFKEFEKFEKSYNELDQGLKDNLFIRYEYIEYLLEQEIYDIAEKELKYLKEKSKSLDSNPYFRGISNFILDKEKCSEIYKSATNFDEIINHEIFKEKINSSFSLIVIVTGNFNIFENEIVKFLETVELMTNNYLFVVLINDATDDQKETIISKIESMKIANYRIEFENTNKFNFNDLEKKMFYTTRRFLLTEQLMKKFNVPIFVTDADTIVLKDLNDFVKDNKNVDMSLTFKVANRNFKTFVSATHALFLPTKCSKIFLDFYKKYVYFLIKNKRNLVWFTDQIALNTTYIYLKRFYEPTFSTNAYNSHKNLNSYFYHTLHNNTLMKLEN